MTVLGRPFAILFSLACIGGALLSSCSDQDTVLALNVTLRQSASSARTLAVSVTQAGQSALGVSTTVTIATKETDAGTVLKSNAFFERITLPPSYTESEASVTVVAKDATGADVGTGTAAIGILPAEVVAGYVTLGEDPPPPSAP